MQELNRLTNVMFGLLHSLRLHWFVPIQLFIVERDMHVLNLAINLSLLKFILNFHNIYFLSMQSYNLMKLVWKNKFIPQ